MTLNDITDAAEFIQNHRKVTLDSPELIGYELITEDLHPSKPYDMVTLAHFVADHDGTRGRAVPYKIAEDKKGNLTLWSLPPELLTP